MENLCYIGCLYKDDIYSHHCYDLVSAIKKNFNSKMNIITSNCSCFSSTQTFGCTTSELLTTECDVVKIPYAPLDPSKKYGKLKYYFTKFGKLNYFLEISRGFSFYFKTKNYTLVHFDQVLKSFGFLSLLTFLILSKLREQKIVITIKELDPFQTKFKNLNRIYNKIDKIIVHSKDSVGELISLGVNEDKIIVINYGVKLDTLKDFHRDRFIFFGGHKLLKGKGFDTLLNALQLISKKKKKIKIFIYTGQGCIGLEDGKKMVQELGLDMMITWVEFLNGSMLSDLYQKSIGCIIPYTGGSGRYPATMAMANATPVIATKCNDLPEYLGDLAIYIEENSADQLADAITNLIDNSIKVNSIGKKMRQRAENKFNWDNIAEEVMEVYNKIY